MVDEKKTPVPGEEGSKRPVDLGADTTLKAHEALDWVERNRPKFLMALGALGVVAVVLIGMDRASESKEYAANEALTLEFVQEPSASSLGADAEEPEGPEPAALLEISEEYRGTSAGKRAVLFAGLRYFEEGQYQEAKAKLQAYSKRVGSGDKYVADQIRYALAVCHEAMGEIEDAQTIFQSLSNSQFAMIRGGAQYGSARLEEQAGNTESAVELYQAIAQSEDTQMAHWATSATSRLDAIYRMNPELEPVEEPEVETPELGLPSVGPLDPNLSLESADPTEESGGSEMTDDASEGSGAENGAADTSDEGETDDASSESVEESTEAEAGSESETPQE